MEIKMADGVKIENITFGGNLEFSFPSISSVMIENLTYQGEWVEGDLVLKYDFSGDHTVRQHFKTKLNESTSFDVGPLKANVHVWLDGQKLWFGVTLCLGILCTPEFKTNIDAPH